MYQFKKCIVTLISWNREQEKSEMELDEPGAAKLNQTSSTVAWVVLWFCAAAKTLKNQDLTGFEHLFIKADKIQDSQV
jgi:hypothetical protein